MAQSSHVGTSRRHTRDHDAVSSIGTNRYTDADWEAKQALCQRELEEARARTAQMEKTMRWWSDCTANWREKWSKVRSERNKARDELKQYKTKLDAVTKELNAAKSEKIDLEMRLAELGSENAKLLALGENSFPAFMSSEARMSDRAKRKSQNDFTERPVRDVDDDASRIRSSVDPYRFAGVGAGEHSNSHDSLVAVRNVDLKSKLEDAKKCLLFEKEEKNRLLIKIDRLTGQMHGCKLDTAKFSDHASVSNESNLSDLEKLQTELQDEVAAKQVLEERLAESKMEMEKLRSENNLQWSKRELLETENVAILRENKRLYNELCDLKEQIRKLNRYSDTNISSVSSATRHSRGSENSKGSKPLIEVFITKTKTPTNEASHCSSEMTNVTNYENKSSSSNYCDDEELAIIEDDDKDPMGSAV